EHPLGAGRVGLRVWQRPARFRNLWIKTGETVRQVPFVPEDRDAAVSGMWRPLTRGSARGAVGGSAHEPFVGPQCQRLTFQGGEGEIGIENGGLTRWGLHLGAGQPYEGYVWARADRPTPVTLAVESGDGGRILDEVRVEARGEGWRRYDFVLKPKA